MVQVIKKGILTTLQSLPLNGWRSYGVSPRGPMDIFGHTMVNQLLGNATQAPVLEMHFPAAQLQFTEPGRFALAGGDFGAMLNEEPIPLWQVQPAMSGDILKFTGLKKGFRTYCGVQGGFDLPLSRYGNEILQDNAMLSIGKAQTGVATAVDVDTITAIYSPANTIACMAAPEYHWLTEDSQALLQTTAFTVSPAGNRMGLPLLGGALQRQNNAELLSGAVAMGTVQLLPNGQCLVLMADHNTTGGYPRIVSVLASELPKLAQLQPGQAFTFQMVSQETAAQQYLRFVQQLNIQPWQ